MSLIAFVFKKYVNGVLVSFFPEPSFPFSSFKFFCAFFIKELVVKSVHRSSISDTNEES